MAAAEGIALSKPKDRYGFREGLEQVRMLPAANGGKGTVISFGPNDHPADTRATISLCGKFAMARTSSPDGCSGSGLLARQ